MKKKTATKKTATPATRPKTKPVPAAAYDGAPAQLLDGSPVFVRWEQKHKLGILTRYNANGKPVVLVCAVDAKGKYVGRFGTERTFEPGEVSRVYMERDWEGMSRPATMTPERAVEVMLESATRLKQADIVAKLKDKEVLDRSKWMIDAVIAAANGNAEGAANYDARMARGPATDERQQPREQVYEFHHPRILDAFDVADVAAAIIRGDRLSMQTMESVAAHMTEMEKCVEEWKAKCDDLEQRLDKVGDDEVLRPLRKDDIINLLLKKQRVRARVTMVADGEMHFVEIDGNGGSRPLAEEGKTWVRDADNSLESFTRGVEVHQKEKGLKVTVTGAPERGDKIQIRVGDVWSAPVDVLRIERDKLMFGKLGRDLKTDRIDGAYRTSDENELWRRFDATLEKLGPSAKHMNTGEDAQARQAMTSGADLRVVTDPNIAPWEVGGGEVIDVPSTEPNLIAAGSPLDVKVGRKWERVTVTSVGSMLINFTGLDGSPGTAAWEDENKRWRRVGVMPAANDRPQHGSMSGQPVEVKVDSKWLKAVIVGNDDQTIMTTRRDPNGTGIVSSISESFPLKAENKRWRHTVEGTPESRALVTPNFANGKDVVDKLAAEDNERKAARAENPLMQPKAAAKKIEGARKAVEKSGVAVIDRAVAATSPVARAVAASEVTMGNAVQPPKTMTLQQRNIAEAKRRGITLAQLVDEQNAEAKSRQASIENTQQSERESAGLDKGGFISMPRLGDEVRIATLAGWTTTKVIALKPNAFVVSGGLVLTMQNHGEAWITGMPTDLEAQRARSAQILAAMNGPSLTPIQDANAAADDEEMALATRRELEALEADEPDEPCPWELPAVTEGVMEQGQPDYEEPAPWEV